MKPRHEWTLLAILAIVTAGGYRHFAPAKTSAAVDESSAPDPHAGHGHASAEQPVFGEFQEREFDGESPFGPSDDLSVSDPAPAIPARSLSGGLPTRGQWRGNPAVGDLNGDGHADFVSSIRRWDRSTPAEGVHVWLGDGAGNWTAANEGLRRDMSYGGAELADLDGDGHLDLAFSGHDTTAHVFVNDGNASWTVMPTFDIDNIASDVAFGDLTGDGIVDLAVLGFYPQEGGLVVLQGDGAGNFTLEATLMDKVNFGAEVAIHDIDADGTPDLLATTSQGLRMWTRSETGTWNERSNGLAIPSIGGSELGFDAKDLDGDGSLEVVVAGMVYDGHDALQILKFEDETWTRVGSMPNDETYFDAVFARVTANGPTSLYLAGKDGVSVLQETAPLHFERVGRIDETVGVINVAAIDVDADGDDECIVVGFGSVRVLEPDLDAAVPPAALDLGEVQR